MLKLNSRYIRETLPPEEVKGLASSLQGLANHVPPCPSLSELEEKERSDEDYQEDTPEVVVHQRRYHSC